MEVASCAESQAPARRVDFAFWLATVGGWGRPYCRSRDAHIARLHPGLLFNTR